MLKYILSILLFIPFFAGAQCQQPLFGACQDTVRPPDIYHPVNSDYSPVCGCDGITYRNCDAAYWWGGINRWDESGPCDNFDVDLNPNIFTPFDQYDQRLRIYMKNSGTATVLIYSSFGRQMFEMNFNINVSAGMTKADRVTTYSLPEPVNYPKGIYILVVSVNGERKSRKFIKLDY